MDDTIPWQHRRALRNAIEELESHGIRVTHAYQERDKLLSVIIQEVDNQGAPCLSESQLWNLAIRVSRSLPMLKEVRAIPRWPHVVERQTDGLVFRRLVNPEFSAVIRPGTGDHTFEVNGKQYHLIPPEDYQHDHLDYYARQAGKTIVAHDLTDLLP
ncbi:hypothetical protein [Lewinella sp. IMCC34183]|uniref:hypothetical protein n=1 Tax=Lewinella sp. IMCC34183 TaxID=2248762 RepID=UPI000E24A266|nr:hypothetical protein [Lewinella sp. IMCC34183]